MKNNIPLATLATMVSLTALGGAAILADDFDITTNPGGGWTQGFNDTAVTGGNDTANDIPFALFTSGGAPGEFWTGDGTTDASFPPNALMLSNRGTGGTQANHWGGGSITWDTGVSYHTWGNGGESGGINGHSADDVIFSTWTVDATGTYDINGTWTENGNFGSADVDVLVNGVSIGTGTISLTTPGDSASVLSNGVALTAGDTVSFRTLRLINAPDDLNGGSARLDASVTLVPEPSSTGLLSLGVIALLMRRRK
jgi:hypothetical protein